MFGAWDWLLVPLGLALLLYLYASWEEGYFRRRGVKSLPSFPLFGNMLKTVLQIEHSSDAMINSYREFPEEKYIGIRQFMRPLIMIKDLDIIKQVTVKDFDHFQDHMMFLDERVDKILGNVLFGMRGQKWRDMRATLSPAFTSSKMRSMFQFIAECGQQTADYFQAALQSAEHGHEEYLTLEMKEVFSRYTTDVIATSAFGIKVDSLKDKENEFYSMGKAVSSSFTGSKMMLKFLLIFCAPRIASLLNIKLLGNAVNNFFRRMVNSTMEIRERDNIFRPDMIQLLMEAKKGTLRHDVAPEVKDTGFATVEESAVGKLRVKRVWTDDELIAQAMIFFLAGFDTASTLLSFISMELVAHQDVQRKLQVEVDEVLASSDGKIDYNTLNSMTYLDMVVTETLRLWPPALVADRRCSKAYTLPPVSKSGQPYQLNVGDAIMIPTIAIHRDPLYYSNPEEFDPERFSEENKASINPASYMPFGVGPRNCIGSRFALLETKAVIFHLMAKFDFVATPKTQIPIKLAKNNFNPACEGGAWVGVKLRST